MKPKRLASAVLVTIALLSGGFCAVAQGRIVLNPGETFTYGFNTLPFVELTGVANGDPGCGVTVFVQQTGVFDFQFETFEGSVTEAPFISYTYQGEWGSTAFWIGAGAHWQDLQGVVRFTGITGTTVIDRFQLDAYLPHDATSMELFSAVVVPEPPVFGMAAIGAVALCTWRRWRLGK